VQGKGALVWPGGGAGLSVPQGLHFPAQGDARGTLICLHGIQTHAAWFEPLAGELTKAGLHVIAVDRRGSGVNTAEPFVKGHADSAKTLMDDLQKQITEAQKLGVPVYLLGTSWGSNLAGVYAVRGTDPQPKGVILLAPATRSRFESGGSAFLASVFSFLAPRFKIGLPFKVKHYQPGAPQPPPSAQPRRSLEKPRDDEEVGEVNEQLAQLLEKDGKSGVLVAKPSFRLVHIGLELAQEWREPQRARDFPLLLLVAERDQIMDNGYAWDAAQRNTTRLTTHVIPGAGHGVQITHPKKIATHILEWIATIDSRVAPTNES
jgi:alpha-beta hydrolase superfamily lysophospholipase